MPKSVLYKDEYCHNFVSTFTHNKVAMERNLLITCPM